MQLQKRAANRLRYLVAGLALFLAAAIALSGWAVNRSQAADENAKQAEAAAATALVNQNDADIQRGLAVQSAATAQADFTHSEAQRLAAEANVQLQSLPHGSEIVALLAVRSLDTEYTPQGDVALVGAMDLVYPKQQFIGHTDWVQGVAYSPDGKYVLTGSADKTARLWDVQSGKEVCDLSATLMSFAR